MKFWCLLGGNRCSGWLIGSYDVQVFEHPLTRMCEWLLESCQGVC